MRLTNAQRQRIINRIFDGNSPVEKALETARQAYRKACLNVYFHVFDAATRRKMKRLPKGWLPQFRDVQYQGELIQVAGVTYKLDLPKAGNYPVPHSFFNGGYFGNFSAGDEIGEAVADADRNRRKSENAVDDAKRDARSILDSCTTDRALIQAWPEIEDIVRVVCADPKSNVPAKIDTAKINKMIGVPVGERAGS